MRLRQEIKAFLMDEEAIGTVEVVLLLVVLIGLVTIVAVDMVAFGLCCLAGKLLGRAS